MGGELCRYFILRSGEGGRKFKERCLNPAHIEGYCIDHYQRFKVEGPTMCGTKQHERRDHDGDNLHT